MAKLSISSVRRSADAPARASAPKTVQAPRHAGGLSLGRAERLGHRVDRLPNAPGIQTKLTLGPAGDTYEQEAEKVSKDVMHTLRSPSVESAGGEGSSATAQREFDDVGAESSVQRMDDEMDALASVQRVEDEMDGMASVQRVEDEMDGMASVQRMGDELDESAGLATVQRDPVGSLDGGPIDGSTESSIESARGSGGELDTAVREPMESAFGANFGGVRVHTDNQADTLNRQLNARAFTTGQDIFFRQGEYQPGSDGGQELLAHELTHVVQQNGDAVRQGGGE
ncbi:MAG: DUF4157 domain-containing protein [Acidobacteriota bacterium]